jgi:hypothetical protein
MQAEPDSYRDILKTIKTKEIQNLIVDTKPENINEFLKGVSLSRIHSEKTSLGGPQKVQSVPKSREKMSFVFCTIDQLRLLV